MSRTITLYIKDILENIEDAEKFVEGMDYDEFIKDKKTNRAVLRCIEVIGEAAKHIPESIRQRYSQIPWRDMAGMRNKVIHFYFGVNLEKVWLVIKEDIPQLKPIIKSMLEDLQRENE